jgi:hypothetical protein
MKHLAVIVLVLFAYACKTQQKAMQTIKIDDKFELSAQKIYSTGEKINISIKNISENELTIFRPMEKFFYKKDGEEWKRVNIFYCPCDASCPPPPEKLVLKKDDNMYKISWNQKENSCGEKRINGVRETIEKQVGAGTYRVEIKYASTAGKHEKYFYEFQIQ